MLNGLFTNGNAAGNLMKEIVDTTVDMTASSSSEGSPAVPMPSMGDLSLEKDVDVKTLLQEIYDLKLRIYYMEEREGTLNKEGEDELYQKYLYLKSENESLSKCLDEKDELLVKAHNVTAYLREQKDMLNDELMEKEKFYKETIQNLEKRLEDMKLCNPKFGLHSTMFDMSGDRGDSFSVLAASEKNRIAELEEQIHSLNCELNGLRDNNVHLEKTVTALQRKINFCTKENSELCNDLKRIQNERDSAVATSAKNNELLNRIEKEKQLLQTKLLRTEEELEKMANKSSNSVEVPSAPETTVQVKDQAAAAVIRELLTENKQTNRLLRKLKEEQSLTLELCSNCVNCQRERKLKKATVLNLRGQKTSEVSTSEDDRSDTASRGVESEPEKAHDNLSKFHENAEIRALLKDKDKQIKQLRSECKKQNYNLQGLVNKELWSKNREIEKMSKLCEKQKNEIDHLRRMVDRTSSTMREIQLLPKGKENILSLSDDVKMLREELRVCLEEKKVLLSKIDHLETKVTSEEEQKSQSSLVHNLRLEVAKHRDDFEEAERARRDAFNACAMLTNRLEELATFLESMLGHENAPLNSKKRLLLLQAIDRSREISKTFSSTFADVETASNAATRFASSVDLSVPILPDYSEINLSFSCDDDEDIVVNRTLQPDDQNSVFNQMMRRSNDFASTEESDSCAAAAAAVKNSVLFVKNLNTSGELIFTSEGVHRIEDDTNGATTDFSQPEYHHVCPLSKIPQSLPTTSMPASTDEIMSSQTADLDSGSESWSVSERKARYTLTSSGSKLRSRKMRPDPCYSTDSDASTRLSKNSPEANEMRLMERRIQHLERINESLRKDLKSLKSCPPKTSTMEQTDVDKVREKTKWRNLLNKVNLENCVDTDKYRSYVENVRRHLRELSKQLIKSKKMDKSFVLAKLKEVSEHFEMSELCCSKLFHYLEASRTRCDVLTSLLQETQSKFEQVMVDLHTTKLAYNSVILEHEQNIFKYKQSELANQQLNEKLRIVDEHRRVLESDLKDVRAQLLEPKDTQNCNCAQLREALDKASQRITELESFVDANDHTLEELGRCKKTVLKLTQENEKLLVDLEELSKYRVKLDEYENQLTAYKKNCERLERELFEKDTIEKRYKDQCAKLEEQMVEKNTLNNSLKLTTDELRKARDRVTALETKVADLDGLVREKENRLLEVQSNAECSTLKLNELKERTEKEIADKCKLVDELGGLLKLSDDKARKFESEIGVLKGLLRTCEEEKRDFRAQIEKQVIEYETMKKQHEQKMQHLLAQIIAYRTEEENSLAAHRQLVEQIEEAQQKKEVWRKSIYDWREKYDELKREKEFIEEKLQLCRVHNSGAGNQANDGAADRSSVRMDSELTKCTVKRDWFMREAELRYQLDVATMTTSHVILEWTRLANEKLRLQRELHQRDKPHYVHHLQSIKSQLETRVRELETINKQLESRLQRLRTNKVFSADLEMTSGESSRAASPTSKKNCQFDYDCSTSKSYTTTTTGYSSSLPSSPNHGGKQLPSPLTTSVPSSPISAKGNDCRPISALWIDTESARNVVTNGDDDRLKTIASRKNSCENNATSPDLGIESDHGRHSSFDFDAGKSDRNATKTEIVKLEVENKTLKVELGLMRKELEETLDKLTALNKNKQKMDKAIFREMYETKNILQQVREHLEDGTTDQSCSSKST